MSRAPSKVQRALRAYRTFMPLSDKVLELRRLLDLLSPSEWMVVAGELELLLEIEKIQAQVRELIARQDPLDRHETEELEALESLVDAPIWDALDPVLERVRQKQARQQQVRSQAELELRASRDRFGRFLDEVRRARSEGAPVMEEVEQVGRIQGLLDEAAQKQRADDSPNALALLERLNGERLEPNIEESIRQKTEQARPLRRVAELLTIQSLPDEHRRYQYNILLRTPGDKGSHGVHIQGSSTLVQQDRRRLGEQVDRLTDRVSAQRRGMAPAEPVGAAPERNAALSTVLQQAHDLGDLMYRLLVPDPMQRYVAELNSAITISTNDLELPWELMCVPAAAADARPVPLCLRLPLARMPLGSAFPRETQPHPAADGKLRFLLIYADPLNNLPGAEREIDALHEKLTTRWSDKIKVDVLKGPAATGEALNDALRGGSYDVIHYAGHAAFDEAAPELSGLLLHEEEVFFAQKIRRLSEGQPLVFLNACSSARGKSAEEAASRVDYDQRSAEGLASAFIYGGALACVGAIWPVYDGPAAEFALGFYTRALQGFMIGEALRRARQDSLDAYPDQLTWGSYVLYGNPTLALVR